MEIALEVGAEDIVDDPLAGCVEVTCEPSDFNSVQSAFEEAGLNPQVAEITWLPENSIEVEGEPAEKLLSLIERLEELDDVQNVYANYDISDAELDRIGG